MTMEAPTNESHRPRLGSKSHGAIASVHEEGAWHLRRA